MTIIFISEEVNMGYCQSKKPGGCVGKKLIEKLQ